MPGIDALKRSSFASASSRSESSTFARDGPAMRRSELVLERPGGQVVEEVLLCLVEKEIDVAPARTPARQPSRGTRRLDPGSPRRRLRSPPTVPPTSREEDHDRPLGKLPEPRQPRPRATRTSRRRSGRTARSAARRACLRRRSRPRARARRRASRRSPCRRTAPGPCRRSGEHARSCGRHPVEPPVEQAGERVLVDLDGAHVEVAPECHLERSAAQRCTAHDS